MLLTIHYHGVVHCHKLRAVEVHVDNSSLFIAFLSGHCTFRDFLSWGSKDCKILKASYILVCIIWTDRDLVGKLAEFVFWPLLGTNGCLILFYNSMRL